MRARLSRRRSARALRIEQPSAMRGRISIASTCLLLSAFPKHHVMPIVVGVCPIGDSVRAIFGVLLACALTLYGTKMRLRGFSAKWEKGHAALFLPPLLRRSHRAR